MDTARKKHAGLWAAIAAVLLILVAFGLWRLYENNRPAPVQGAKTITVQVVVSPEDQNTYIFHTDAEYLRQVLETEAGLVAGEESDYGLFLTTVDGVTANADAQEWWCITKGGESVFTGVDETPVADGDAFELTLTVGW